MSGRSSAIFFDTHALVWAATAPERLTPRAIATLRGDDGDILVSAVTAFEYLDLNGRGRFGRDLPLSDLLKAFWMRVAAFPVEAVEIAASLPDVHRDPVDRMLVGHAVAVGGAIVTADATIARYPVMTIW